MTQDPNHGQGPPPEADLPPSDADEPVAEGGRSGSFGEGAAEMANESFDAGAARPTQEPTEVEEARGATPADDELTVTKMELAERTADLQRIQAEFLNYKRRVDRDRDLIRENATYASLTPIIDVLDTIDRAREHGDLDPGFRAVAEQLERVVASLGLVKFGAVGDVFDPTIHEALSHIGEDPDVQATTAKVVARSGYRIGERVVRAAQVLVVDPPSGPTE